MPNIMKNMLQKGVDDMIEGKVKEQVEKLVHNAMKTAAKAFKRSLPGVPSLAADGDEDAADRDGNRTGDPAGAEDDEKIDGEGVRGEADLSLDRYAVLADVH